MKNNSLCNAFLLLLIAAALFVAAFFAYKYYKTVPQPYKADTITKIDTFYQDTVIYKDKIKLVPKIVEIIKRDTIANDTVLTTEQKFYQETFYMKDDTATVGVITTGIDTQIDTISILLRTRRPTVVQTVEITKYVEKKRSIIHIQPQVTFGYDVINKQWAGVVGFGVGIDI